VNFENEFISKIISILYYIKMVEIHEENLDNIINNEEEAEPIKRSRGRPKNKNKLRKNQRHQR